MSRFTLLDRPLVLPMKCAVCGNSAPANNRYVDMDVRIDRFGRLYLCSGCIAEAAELLGMTYAAKLAVAEEKCKVAVKRLAEVIDENRNLKDAVATLRNLDSPGVNIYDSFPYPRNEKSAEPDEGEGQDDTEPSEPTPSRESGSVPKTTELFQFS